MARYRSLVYREAYAYFGYSSLTFTFLPYCCACLGDHSHARTRARAHTRARAPRPSQPARQPRPCA
jgi:hypothetical protein